MTLLNAAIKYADAGFKVFPCVPGQKRPLTQNGVLDATDDADQIEQWWTATPDANIGIATAGLLVVDVDPMPDGTENPWLANQPENLRELAAAPMAITPRGGRHYSFKAPSAGFRNTASKIAANVDTRADGGYVLAAASQVAGNQYRWASTEPDQVNQLAEPPGWLLSLLDSTAPKVAPPGDDGDSQDIPAGQRNTELTSWGGSVARKRRY